MISLKELKRFTTESLKIKQNQSNLLAVANHKRGKQHEPIRTRSKNKWSPNVNCLDVCANSPN